MNSPANDLSLTTLANAKSWPATGWFYAAYTVASPVLSLYQTRPLSEATLTLPICLLVSTELDSTQKESRSIHSIR